MGTALETMIGLTASRIVYMPIGTALGMCIGLANCTLALLPEDEAIIQGVD